MKFKVGDRVKYIRHCSTVGTNAGDKRNFNIGQNYTITEVENQYFVDDITREVYENQIEYAKIRNTKIARKVYPHYIEEGEWLICKST